MHSIFLVFWFSLHHAFRLSAGIVELENSAQKRHEVALGGSSVPRVISGIIFGVYDAREKTWQLFTTNFTISRVFILLFLRAIDSS